MAKRIDSTSQLAALTCYRNYLEGFVIKEAPHLLSGGPLIVVAIGTEELSQQATASSEAEPDPAFRLLFQPQKPSKPKPLAKSANAPGIGTGLTEPLVVMKPE